MREKLYVSLAFMIVNLLVFIFPSFVMCVCVLACMYVCVSVCGV